MHSHPMEDSAMRGPASNTDNRPRDAIAANGLRDLINRWQPRFPGPKGQEAREAKVSHKTLARVLYPNLDPAKAEAKVKHLFSGRDKWLPDVSRSFARFVANDPGFKQGGTGGLPCLYEFLAVTRLDSDLGEFERLAPGIRGIASREHNLTELLSKLGARNGIITTPFGYQHPGAPWFKDKNGILPDDKFAQTVMQRVLQIPDSQVVPIRNTAFRAHDSSSPVDALLEAGVPKKLAVPGTSDMNQLVIANSGNFVHAAAAFYGGYALAKNPPHSLSFPTGRSQNHLEFKWRVMRNREAPEVVSIMQGEPFTERAWSLVDARSGDPNREWSPRWNEQCDVVQDTLLISLLPYYDRRRLLGKALVWEAFHGPASRGIGLFLDLLPLPVEVWEIILSEPYWQVLARFEVRTAGNQSEPTNPQVCGIPLRARERC